MQFSNAMPSLASFANFLARGLRVGARKFEAVAERRSQAITLRPARVTGGRVVMFYILDPWIYPETRRVHYHSNRWECATMVDTFLEAGHVVDVVDYQSKYYRPPADCVIAIDTEHSFRNFGGQLPPQCTKVYHAPTTHWLHWNRAELRRLDAIRERRGVALQPRRQLPPNPGIDVAQFGTYVGNAFTAETYAYAGKPMYRIPISSVVETATGPHALERIRRRFVWFGSIGLAHKGLDVVLEAFAQMPDLELTVAGGTSFDQDFVAAYDRELNHTPNIRHLGWIDATSPAFQALMDDHLAVVYPSCAEGGAGSVIACMHCGLIPVVTREASIDTHDFGVLTSGDSVPDIIRAVRMVEAMSAAELQARRDAAQAHVRRVHTRKAFAETYRGFAREVLGLSLPAAPRASVNAG